jgi:hypothetical protein
VGLFMAENYAYGGMGATWRCTLERIWLKNNGVVHRPTRAMLCYDVISTRSQIVGYGEGVGVKDTARSIRHAVL